MSEIIYKALTGLDRLFGGEGILWVVVILLIVFFFFGRGSSKFSYRFSRVAPALMTSVGILGTFCGIFIALQGLELSPGKINDSIKTLLDGMKTAFITSLLGLAFAISFQAYRSWQLSRTRSGKAVSSEQREVLDRLDAIRQAIAGEGDSSMVTQMQKMRDENRDGFKKLDGLNETIRNALIQNLEALIKDIRELIGKQLGDSLQKLIDSIEEALIRQFGKTFIEFNAATQSIKKWQEDHREQVEQLTAAFNTAANHIAQIAADCEKIPLTMNQLSEIIKVAHQDVEALNRQVEAFAGMRQQAEQSFPIIKQHLDKVGVDLENSAAGFAGLEKTIRTTFQSAEQEVRQIAQQHSENVQSVAAKMRETLEKTQRDSADKVTGIVESAVQQFSKEIDGEINRITKEWGSNMISIAERCQEAINKVEGSRSGDRSSL